jgi:hypothetical protein
MNGFPKGKGIEDFGDFKEGFCFKLNQVHPITQVFVICASDQKTKLDFMGYIKKMKCLLQREQGIVLLPQGPKGKIDPNKPITISGMLNPKIAKDKEKNKKAGALIDGYWITLQTWSQCTLKCGGGKSYFHRMCVPPKEGGKPCEGESILSKDCNKQPCPLVDGAKGKNSIEQKTMKPIVKIMPFSSRPQRYSKCVIKESDMMYTKDMGKKDATLSQVSTNLESQQTMQVPVRVVMNNRTITIFAGEGYETHLDTFNILTSNLIVPDPNKVKGNDINCFWINSEDGRAAHLCPFGCSSESKVVEEWRYDFNLFKYQCNYGHREQELDMNLQKRLEGKLKAAKAAALAEAEDDMKKKAQKSEERKLQTKIQQTNSVALQAVQKEINLEELIKNEEKEREVQEEEEMKQKIAAEQEKQVKKLNYFK